MKTSIHSTVLAVTLGLSSALLSTHANALWMELVGTNEGPDGFVSASGVLVPITITGGWYDSTADQGAWELAFDLGTLDGLQVSQGFTLDSDTGEGVLNSFDECNGDSSGATCALFSDSFSGAFTVTPTPLWVGDFVFSLPTDAGIIEYSVSLVQDVPVPAAAWLLGSALAGVLGVGRIKASRRRTGACQTYPAAL